MSPTLDACLRSWPFDPWLLAALLLTAGVYLRGWLVLRRRDPRRWHGGRLAAFLGGLAAHLPGPGVADRAVRRPAAPGPHGAAPAAHDGGAAAPLAGRAAVPLAAGFAAAGPHLTGSPRCCPLAPLRRLFGRLTHPLTAWLLFVAATWFWHAPPVYDLALRSDGWHYLQHVCFLGTALVFWYPVVRPYPGRPRWSPWLLLPYLILADVQNTLLSALLTFSDRLLYPYYAEVPRLAELSPLDDQAAAGVMMWVPGSLAFLVPLFVHRRPAAVSADSGDPRRRHDLAASPPALARSPRRTRFPADRRTAPASASPRPSICCASRCWAASCDGDTPGSACRSPCCCWPG